MVARYYVARMVTVVLLLPPLLGCGGGASPPSDGGGPADPPPSFPSLPTLADGFETGLGAWSQDAHVPHSVEDPTVPVPWAIDLTDQPVHEGISAVRLWLDGRQDDGTIWLERALPVAPHADWTVHVSAAYWSESESFNTTAEVALYAGDVSPEVELDFDVSGILNEVGGWKVYAHTFDVTSGADGQVHIGVGVNVVWETWITYYLDDVRVWIEPH